MGVAYDLAWTTKFGHTALDVSLLWNTNTLRKAVVS